jgi:hypothetical protein
VPDEIFNSMRSKLGLTQPKRSAWRRLVGSVRHTFRLESRVAPAP